MSASYAYDYLRKRIKRTVGGVETGYLYQAEDIVKETSGGIVTDYLHGIGIDDPVMLDRGGVKSYYFGDGLGSIREVTDITGTVQNNYSYGAWGELRASSSTVANSYGYTGREFAEEGLFFYRVRYMDPAQGRFVSEDASQIMNDQNGYRYVNNNPANSFDPYGLYTPLTTEEQINCQATIMEALNIVRKWSKKQCCKKEFSQWGCNMTELLAAHEGAVKLGEDKICAPIVEEGEIKKPEYKAYMNTGGESIYICPSSCRWKFEPAAFIAQRIVHELMHFCQQTGDLWFDFISDLKYQHEVDDYEQYYADQAGKNCRIGKKSS